MAPEVIVIWRKEKLAHQHALAEGVLQTELPSNCTAVS